MERSFIVLLKLPWQLLLCILHFFLAESAELSLLLFHCIRGCGKYYPKNSSENPIIAYHLGTFGMLFPTYYDLGHANSNLDCNLGWIACKLGRRHWVECNLGTPVYSEYNCNRVWMIQRRHKVCETCEICLFMRLRHNSVWKYIRMCLFFFVYMCVCLLSLLWVTVKCSLTACGSPVALDSFCSWASSPTGFTASILFLPGHIHTHTQT